ncbi:MAG: ROK family transcriptional regulator [Oscillospiraceae bacterium]|nr:ROK family transcriptional regulator [Oscillospiraceae bacterium]
MSNRKNEIHPLKEMNANLILNALSEMKTATRKQLADHTGLSQPTVNTIVQELEQKGVVRPGSFAASEGGRRPQCYTLQTDHLRAGVIRVLPRELAYIVATIDGKVISRNSWALTPSDSHLEKLQSLLQTLKKQDDDIRVFSVGVPGAVGPGGALYSITQIPSLEGVTLSYILQEKLGLPVYVENDMNSVALGSIASSIGQPDSDMVLVHIGQGVGAGIVMGGRIVRGFSRFAGEIAHLNKVPGVDPCATLEHLLNEADGLQEKVKLIADLIINIICLLNPPTIAFGGEFITEEILQGVQQLCENNLPNWAIPSFHLMTNESAAYEKGLLTLVRDMLIEAQFEQARGRAS